MKGALIFQSVCSNVFSNLHILDITNIQLIIDKHTHTHTHTDTDIQTQIHEDPQTVSGGPVPSAWLLGRAGVQQEQDIVLWTTTRLPQFNIDYYYYI